MSDGLANTVLKSADQSLILLKGRVLLLFIKLNLKSKTGTDFKECRIPHHRGKERRKAGEQCTNGRFL